MNEAISFLAQMNEHVPLIAWLSGLVLLVSLWVNLRSQRRTQQVSAELKQIQQDLRAITLSAIGVGGRVIKLERSHGIPTQAQEVRPVLVHPQPEPIVDSVPYDQAIYMARTGSTVDDISMACGVSQNEAELIQIMHRLDKTA